MLQGLGLGRYVTLCGWTVLSSRRALSLTTHETNWEATTGEILPWFGPVTSSPFSISVSTIPMDGTFALRLTPFYFMNYATKFNF